jgi:hypothetical protein
MATLLPTPELIDFIARTVARLITIQATFPKEGMKPRVVWANVYNSCMQAKGYLKAE